MTQDADYKFIRLARNQPMPAFSVVDAHEYRRALESTGICDSCGQPRPPKSLADNIVTAEMRHQGFAFGVMLESEGCKPFIEGMRIALNGGVER